MTTDNNMFDVSGWFRGPVNKKMMLPDNESMFGGIDYWISRPVFNDQVVIEMSFSVSHQSLKTDDLLLLFEGFKYDYEKMIRSAFRNENDSMNLRSHEFSGVVFMTPIGLHSMRTTLFKGTYRTNWRASALVSKSHENLSEIVEVICSAGCQVPLTFIYNALDVFTDSKSYYTHMLEEYGKDYMMNLGIVCDRYASFRRWNYFVVPEFDFQNRLGYDKWFIKSIHTMAEKIEKKWIDEWTR